MVCEDGKTYKTRDRNIVIILFAKGLSPVGVESKNGVKTFLFDWENSREIVEGWFKNLPIPLEDARAFIIALELFNSYIRE